MNKKINKKGATFIELLLYVAIFLILAPILLSISISSMRTDKQHNLEKQISFDSRFAAERIYNLIGQAKRVDVASSVLNDENGILALIMEDNSSVIISLNPATEKIEINEDGIISELSSDNAKVERLYFEPINDNIVNENVVLGLTIHLELSGAESFSSVQDYILSANLEKGDYDGDGCIDALDSYPENSACCGDIDGDTRCDQQDNCVQTPNLDQEDLDEDGIGNACDDTPAGGEGGGGGGGSTPFNCSGDDTLSSIIHTDPQELSSYELKDLFMASSPLSEDILNELIDHHEILYDSHFKDIFIQNVKLTNEIYDRVMDMDISYWSYKRPIENAQEDAEENPEYYDKTESAEYSVQLISDDTEEPINEWNNRVKFTSGSNPLGEDGYMKTDYFEITVTNGNLPIKVTVNNISGENYIFLDSENPVSGTLIGFKCELKGINGNDYTIAISSEDNDEPLDWVEFDFDSGADVTSPTSDYTASRYFLFCGGGCSQNCGDTGTGIITGVTTTDICYKENGQTPEWCREWYSFLDNDNNNGLGSTYLGGSQGSEETVYIEKRFESILDVLQLENLNSITIAGEVAYQSTDAYFCDVLSGSCPMEGDLVNTQDIELYDWILEEWVSIGNAGTDGSTSDQQTFEITYNGENPQKFIGTEGYDEDKIKIRMKFKWAGSSETAPCVMLIDYLVVHLQWS